MKREEEKKKQKHKTVESILWTSIILCDDGITTYIRRNKRSLYCALLLLLYLVFDSFSLSRRVSFGFLSFGADFHTPFQCNQTISFLVIWVVCTNVSDYIEFVCVCVCCAKCNKTAFVPRTLAYSNLIHSQLLCAVLFVLSVEHAHKLHTDILHHPSNESEINDCATATKKWLFSRII